MRTLAKYGMIVLACLAVLYLSVDVQKTSVSGKSAAAFDVAAYTTKLWEKDLPAVLEQAPDLVPLMDELRSTPEKAFTNYGHKLGISNTLYFLARGTGTVASVEDENILVELVDGTRVQVATDFIFGNAVRDGSGIVNIDDFLNMTDFNNVSVALNEKIREKVAVTLKTSAKPGMQLSFAGAFEINEKNRDLAALRIIPVIATLSDARHE